MLWHPETLGTLRDCLNSMIQVMGEDAPIGHRGRDDNGDFLDMGICFSWVCVRSKDGQIVGSEGNDYELRLNPETEFNAIALYCATPDLHKRNTGTGNEGKNTA